VEVANLILKQLRRGILVMSKMKIAGGCSVSQTETTGRLGSLALRSGIPWKLVLK
jgi:hypothetical protein